MKKQLFWIVPIVLYVFAAVLDNTTAYFNRTWFNIKHVIYFGLIVYVLLVSLYLVYRFFIKRYIKKQVIKIAILVLLVTLATVGTVTASNLQLTYINKFEVPKLYNCTHYDQYGNVLFTNNLSTCDGIENMEITTNSISFTVNQFVEGTLRESIEVDDGIGFRYYQGTINYDYEYEYTYNGPYINSYTYTLHRTTNKENGSTITGNIFKQVMETSYDVDNEITVTYTNYLGEYDLTDGSDFPEIDTITPVIKKYVSTLIPIEEDRYTSKVEFKEITYDEEGNEIVEIFGNGVFETLNDPLIAIDFYEDGIHTGDTTDYYFDYDLISIKNSTEVEQSAGVDRSYDERILTFDGITNELFKAGEAYPASNLHDAQWLTMGETYGESFLLKTFEVNLDRSWYFDFDFTHNLLTINDELYIDDGNNYHKFEFTEYGCMIKEYVTNEFSFEEMFDIEPDHNVVIDYSILADFIEPTLSSDLLSVYNYRYAIQAPGVLSRYHFYQHNHLIEHLFIENYDKLEE